jgi:hypothetical protein
VDFSFKVSCPTDFDPLQQQVCPPEPRTEPAIDYLARDYLSLRQLMLDRMALLLPDWQERNPADAGIALVELLAYVGDQLSYWQDAVATEAYLGTCRLRVSARRHARLVDYFMHDGCNARAWVQVRLREGSPPVQLDRATLYSAVPDLPSRITPGSAEHRRAADSGATVFATMAPLTLFAEHNEMPFYTWGARACCLPEGAVRATLRGNLPNLAPGMVLIFQEVRSPRTGDPDDADLRHRHAVRLIEVTPGHDPVGRSFEDPPADGGLDVTEIRWSEEDALPFPVCVSAETAERYGRAYVEDVSVALGNIVLADHGALVGEDLGVVPAPRLEQVRPAGAERESEEDRCRPDRAETIPARFRPALRYGPVTQAVPLGPVGPLPSARAAMRYRPQDAVPQVWPESRLNGGGPTPWSPRLDLISSSPGDEHVVVEVEADGRARLRFGDGTNGSRPASGARFTVSYRVGNGVAGNVGANTLLHIVSADDGIERVTNPLPAEGGLEMESIEEVRQYAPVAFRPQDLTGQPGRPDGRTLARAVTPRDYAAVSETHAEVQRAAASFRWTGSWRTVSLAVDRIGGRPVNEQFERELRDHLERFRLAGHDLEIDPPRLVALEISMSVRVKPGYFVGDVRRPLLELFSNRVMADGRRGVFHPDNLTFGQTVYLSPLYAAAQSVDGVESVRITRFQRRDQPGTAALDLGRLELGRLEVARLDNDPNFPERGVFELTLEGGR